MLKKITSSKVHIRQKHQRFKYFEILDPRLIDMIETKVEIDYFPRGNDYFLQEFVNITKEYISKVIK